MTKYKAKGKLRKARLGLYRQPQSFAQMDGRRKVARNRKIFITGIEDDLGGPLSFGQGVLAEIAFFKYFTLGEFVRYLLESEKKDAILAVMLNPKYNTTVNTTSNTLRSDMVQIYGAKGIRKVEKRMKSLNGQLLELAQGEQPEGQGETKETG